MSKEYLEIVELYKSLEKDEDKTKRINLDSVVNLTLNRKGFKLKEEFWAYVFYQRGEEVFIKRNISEKGLSSTFNYALATIKSDNFEKFKDECCIKAYPKKGISADNITPLVFESMGVPILTSIIIGAALGGLPGASAGLFIGLLGSIPSSLGSFFWLDRKRIKKDKKKIKKFDEEHEEKMVYNEQALESLFDSR